MELFFIWKSLILLLHLIKQQAENRTTKSWDVSIRNSIREIMNTNKRRKAGGCYIASEELKELEEKILAADERIAEEELKEILVAAYPNTLDLASLEVT